MNDTNEILGADSTVASNSSEGNMNENDNAQNSEQTTVAPVAQVVVARGRGRPSLVDEKVFIDAFQSASSLEAVVKSMPILCSGDLKKAKLYVSMRAAALRKKGIDLKTFPRGRKPDPNKAIVKSVEPELEGWIEPEEPQAPVPGKPEGVQPVIKSDDSLADLVEKIMGESDSPVDNQATVSE